MIDITMTGIQKTPFELHVARELAPRFFERVGIKPVPNRAKCPHDGHRYFVTGPAVQRVMKAFPGEVMHFGKPFPQAKRER